MKDSLYTATYVRSEKERWLQDWGSDEFWTAFHLHTVWVGTFLCQVKLGAFGGLIKATS